MLYRSDPPPFVPRRYVPSYAAPTGNFNASCSEVAAATDAYAGTNSAITAAITETAVTSDASTARYGQITTPVLKNNAGALLQNETGATAWSYVPATGALVLTKTSQTTDIAGLMTFTDQSLSAGTSYRVVFKLASGAEGMDTITAT